MRVYGLDFTSAPKKGKPLTLAICRLDNSQLLIEKFHEFGTDDNDATTPLEGYANWLNGRGESWKKDQTWIAGVDFPFGMPIAAISRFGWGNVSASTRWEDYIRKAYDMHRSLDGFKTATKGWSYPDEVSESGNPIKIQSKRLTDQVAHAQSPMKFADNPFPGAMFYQGCKALLESDIRLPGLRSVMNNVGSPKIAIEAYPRLVAQKFIPKQPEFSELVARKRDRIAARKNLKKSDPETRKNLTAEIKIMSANAKSSLRYKEAGTNEVALANRSQIIEALENSSNPYGVQISFETNIQRANCISDPKADLLDSVLCAVQAAWSYVLRECGFGIPSFDNHELLRQQVALEGWIVDPAMWNIFGKATP